jgi:hypothetical protein
VTWELLLIPSAPGVVVAFLLLAAWLEDRTLAPRPVVVRARPGTDGEAGQERPARS